MCVRACDNKKEIKLLQFAAIAVVMNYGMLLLMICACQARAPTRIGDVIRSRVHNNDDRESDDIQSSSRQSAIVTEALRTHDDDAGNSQTSTHASLVQQFIEIQAEGMTVYVFLRSSCNIRVIVNDLREVKDVIIET